MLFKIDNILVDLNEINFITYEEVELDDEPWPLYKMCIYTKSSNEDLNEFLVALLSKSDLYNTLEDLKDYKSMFYELNSDLILNIKNISSIVKSTEGLQITFKNEKISDNNLFVHFEEDFDLTEADDLLNEMSRL